jgi:hypothetical protein
MVFEHLAQPTSRYLNLLLAGCLAAVTLVATIYTFLAVPYGDDFCRASLGTIINGDWVRHVERIYQVWSGRWAVHALYALTFPHIKINTNEYNWLLLLAFLTWLAVFFILVRVALGPKISHLNSVAVAGILCAIFWAGMPNTGETWYWLTGLVEYGLPFLLSCIALAILTGTVSSMPRKMIRIALASGLAFLVTGFNELVGLLLGGIILATGAVVAMRRRYGQAIEYGCVVLITIIGLGINLLAPGTMGHSAEFPIRHSLARAIDLEIFSLSPPLGWFIDPKLLCLSVILLTSPWFLSLQPRWVHWNLRPVPLVLIVPIVFTAAVLCGHFFVSYAQGTAPPNRVLNVLYALFICGWFLWMVTAARYIAQSFEASSPLMQAISVVAGIAFSFSLIMSPNVITGVVELRYFAVKWSREVAARDQLIRNEVNSGTETIVVQPISFKHPSLYFWNELEMDPSNWRNECVARYYGLKKISVEPGAIGGSRGIW